MNFIFFPSTFLCLRMVLLTAVILAGGLSCSQQGNHGVKLVLSTSDLKPTTTFELRFDEAMVVPEEVMTIYTNSPLVIEPPLEGKFSWLSQRSGVFTPSEPLRLGERYRFSLSPGLRTANQRPVSAYLEEEFSTPSLKMIRQSPTRFSTSNLQTFPSLTFWFNAEVVSDTSYFEFQAADGSRIPARVTRGRRSYRSDTIWWDRFPDGDSVATRQPKRDSQHALEVTPAEALTVGIPWKLVVKKGLPALSFDVALEESTEISLGTVAPLAVRSVEPSNSLILGRSLRIGLSHELHFSMNSTNIAEWLRVTPRVENLNIKLSGSTVRLEGDFQVGRDYDLYVYDGLKAVGDLRLEETFHRVVTFEPIEPRIAFPSYGSSQLSQGRREMELSTINVPGVRLRAKFLNEHTLVYALRGHQAHLRSSRQSRPGGLAYDSVPGWTEFETNFVTEAEVDRQRRVTMSWNDVLADRSTGAFFVEAVEDHSNLKGKRGAQTLIQITDLGVVWKWSGSERLVWAFSYATGKPLAGVTLRVVTDENKTLKEVKTDQDGVARLPRAKDERWMLALLEDDLRAVPLGRLEGEISRYSFDIPLRWGSEKDERLMVFSDRSVYRPGETVHLKVLGRTFEEDGWTLPSTNRLQLTGTDAKRNLFLSTNLVSSGNGSAELSFVLPDSVVGSYRLNLDWGEARARHYFEVAEFKPALFEVKLPGPRSFSSMQSMTIPVEARYQMGRSLYGGKVRWSVRAEETSFSAAGFEAYKFGNCVSRRYSSYLGNVRSSHVLDGEMEMTKGGTALIEPELALTSSRPGPFDVQASVEVTDLTQQTIGQSAQFTRHTSEFYLGLKNESGLLRAKAPQSLDVVAVASDGKEYGMGVDVELTVTRLEWMTTRMQGAGGRVRYERDLRQDILVEQKFRIGDEVPQVVYPMAGQYLVELWARDLDGQEVSTAVVIHVYGEDHVVWDYKNSEKVQLLPDQKSYEIGQVAKVLVKAPIEGEALVTVERDEVRRSFVQAMDGNSTVLEIPLEKGDVPNVFVSVTLVRGVNESSRAIKVPEYRVGYCQLNVKDPLARLTVEVAPEKSEYEPGEKVDVVASVLSYEGNPQPGAEVTLYAVDEGVLGLTGYEVPDPYAFFYSPRGLQVRSGVLLDSLYPEDPDKISFRNKGYVIGGGGGSERVRKNFLASAFWKADAVTGEDGQVLASFTAPDSLTRYRVMAVVTRGDKQFGHGQSDFKVHKPFMLEPALPRFGNVGDKMKVGVIAHNQTSNSGKLEVTLELDETVGGGVLKRSVTLAAGASQPVVFDVQFEQVGEAKWIWRGQFTSGEASGKVVRRDALESKFDVGFPAPLLREIRQVQVEKNYLDLLADLNPQLLEGTGEIEVRLSASRVIWALEAADHLLSYPYGCVEQTSSSLMPWLVLRGFDLSWDRSKQAMDLAISKGVNRLFTMQTRSGGLAYWPGASAPMFWGSAYGAMTLAMAKRNGIVVPEKPMENLLQYLSRELRNPAHHRSFEGCLALYALTVAGKPEMAYAEKFYEQREHLPRQGLVLLAMTMLEADPKVDVEDLLVEAKTDDETASLLFGSNARASAMNLLGWIRYRPDSPVVEKGVEALLKLRKRGHWSTTQGNAWSLIALAEYARVVESGRPPVRGELVWGKKSVPFKLGGTRLLYEKQFPVTAGTTPPKLVLRNPSKTLLRSQVNVAVRPALAEQPRQDRGFSIQRHYTRLDAKGQPMSMEGLAVGDTVLVTLDLILDKSASYVAIDDPLPSVFEAIHPEFKTQQTGVGKLAQYWRSDFRELRSDRALFFRNRLEAGEYRIRYLARVRASGVAMAPATKVEEMYHPDRYGLSASVRVSSAGLD